MTIPPAKTQMKLQAFLLVCLPSLLTAQYEPMQQRITLVQKKVKDAGTDCQDREFHVSFRLPLKWSVQLQNRWTDAGGEKATTLSLRDPKSNVPVGLYYRLFEDPRPLPAEALAQALQEEVDKKVALRANQGLINYRISTENCERRQAGTRQALSCIAQYNNAGGVMLEYLTWIRSESCLAQFWVMAPTDKMGDVRGRLENLIQSLQIP